MTSSEVAKIRKFCEPEESGRLCRLAVVARLRPALPHRRQKLHSLLQEPLAFLGRCHHLAHRLEDVTRPEIEAAVEAFDRAVYLVGAQTGILHRALLVSRLVQQRIDREIAVFSDVFEQLRTGIRRGERDLNRLAVHFAGELDSLRNPLPRLPPKPEAQTPLRANAHLPA